MALIWEDKEIRFDMPFSELRLKTSEKIIDRLESIEDTKGNGGDRGRLIVTNLRILWHSVTAPRVNLSIGYNCIISSNTKTVNSKLRGTTQALHILATSNHVRFEFIFTNLIPGSQRHFTSVMGVHKAYVSSRMYRELKMRSSVIHNKQVKILPLEQIYTTVYGVWNLSSDQGNLGTLVITNVRMIWFADMNEGFNISLPYLQMSTVKLRESKFGMALVVTSTPISGGYILGFKIDPKEKLHSVYKELTSLYTIYSNNPIYGVEFKWTNAEEHKEKVCLIEDMEEGLDEPRGEMTNTLLVYLADEGHVNDKEPEYSNDLGLAIEHVKEGYSLQKLWEVIPSDKI